MGKYTRKTDENRFFTNLKDVLETKTIGPHRVYNMDESGILTVPNKIPKVIAPTGKNTVGKIVSSERGQLITAVCCMNAAGKYVPPALIFPRKRKKEELINGAPVGSLLQMSDSGFINGDLFLEWVHHFQKHEKSSMEDPVLLILDNHASHISLQAINKCRSFGIHLLSLPPHSSHRLQPLDRGFFGPLKTAYGQECVVVVVSNPGRAITQYQIAQLFGNAYSKVASVEKATKAFQACGIWPYNPDIFSPEDFAPALMTDRPFPCQEPLNQPSSDSEDLPLSRLQNSPQGEKVISLPSRSSVQPREPGLSVLGLDNAGANQITSPFQPCTKTQLSDTETAKSTSAKESATSTTAVLVSPQVIKPYPKTTHRPNKSRKGKKSELLTASPYKNQLESEIAAKTKSVKRKVLAGSDKKKSNAAKSNSKHEIHCPRCDGIYTDRPDSDWIMCSMCIKWYHEDCTAYAGLGQFIC